MTQLQAAKLSTRLISAYLFYRAFTNLFSAINGGLAVFEGTFSMLDGVTQSRLMHTLYVNGALEVLEFCLEMALAILLYRAGPGVIRFLVGPMNDAPVDDLPKTQPTA